MTRGKIQFVEKNWQVYSTLEFNGDMYPSGHGHEIIMHFKKGGGFRTRDDYEAYAVDFDERNFGYRYLNTLERYTPLFFVVNKAFLLSSF